MRKLNWKPDAAVQTVLILWFLIAMALQQNVGLADNGDFTRSMRWISPGPVGIEPNWPPAGTEDWDKRFNNYWIPSWKLDWNLERPTTSAFFLWLPGAVLNYLIYSRTVLYIPILSLFSKLLLFGVLLLVFLWIGRKAPYKTLLLIGIGAPLVLLFTSTEYIAYFNTFYLESASFVFLFLFLASVLLLKYNPFPVFLIFSLACLFLLATAKPANLYWPLVGVPFVLFAWSRGQPRELGMLAAAGLLLILVLTAASFLVTRAGSNQANPYNSLFVGVLHFSDDPSAHLRDLGMDGGEECILASAFTPAGATCLARYPEQISHQNTVRVVMREPAILFRMVGFAMDNMQDLSIDYLGKYALDDPRSRISSPIVTSVEKQRLWSPSATPAWLNLWAALKFRVFPTGLALVLTLVGFAAWFLWTIRSPGFRQDLAVVGLICTAACFADMTVAVLGDGMVELVRHLFLSNLVFDIAALAFLNGMLLAGVEYIRRKLPEQELYTQE